MQNQSPKPTRRSSPAPRRAMVGSLLLSSLTGLAFLSPPAIAGVIEEHAGAVTQDGAQFMVVNTDDAALRCGDQDIFYAITRLKKGTVLQTAGVSGDFTMVVLPKRVGALVPADEAQISDDAKTVTLRVDSKLRAPSQLMGLSGAWKQLYNTELPAGTQIEVIDTLKNKAGTVVGYRVVADKSPSGELPIAFIKTDALRPALAGEIEGNGPGDPLPPSAEAEPDEAPAEVPETTTPVIGEPQTTPTDTSEDATEKASEDQAVDSSLMDPKVGDEQPVEIENRTPVSTDSESSQSSTNAVHTDRATIPASKLENLEAAFDDARMMPRAELDDALDELLAEFSRTREQAEDGSSLARALDQRIEWINIRIASRDQRRAIDRALAQYDADADETTRAIDQWQQGRAYQLVGRMVTSSVYTGANLPLLYRIQGIDPVTGQPRTIGYIAPKQDQDLRHLLGRVVGVLGTRRMDESLHLLVVEPQRIDPMPE